MHELPITKGILDLVLDHASRAGGGRITVIHLVVGELASMVDDCVQFYWDIISEGTPAEGAELRFRRVPLQFECLDCEMLFAPRGDDFLCTACSSPRVRVGKGEELRVEAIDLETEPEASAAAPLDRR